MKINDVLESKLENIRVDKSNLKYILDGNITNENGPLTLEEVFEYYKQYSINEERKYITKHFTFNGFIRHHRTYMSKYVPIREGKWGGGR